MVPWRPGTDKEVHPDLDAGIAVDATQRHPVYLAVMQAAERRAALAAEAKAPSRCRFMRYDLAFARGPGKRSRDHFGIG